MTHPRGHDTQREKEAGSKYTLASSLGIHTLNGFSVFIGSEQRQSLEIAQSKKF